MYMALTSTAAQRDVVNAAAKSVLKGDDLDLFSCVLQLASRAISARNNIAHGIWGVSPDIPDALLLIPPSIVLESHGKTEAGLTYPLDMSAIQVYKKLDFEEVITRISLARNNLELFWMALATNEPAQWRDQSRQRLCNEPDVQRELSRIAKGRKSSPSTPQQ